MIKNQRRGLKWLVLAVILLLIITFILIQLSVTKRNRNLEQPQTPTLNTAIVKAQDYQQFWLWTPPKDTEKLHQAHTLYLLQGEIRPTHSSFSTRKQHTKANSPTLATLATLTPQGLGVRPLFDKEIWLVYRATSQDWSPDVMSQILSRLEKWQRAGNHVTGIQIDFDAPTYQLAAYATLLKNIRQQLPQRYRLSVTGLLDWANQANDPHFINLGHAVDELVMQTYQDTTTLPSYAQYLKKLDHISFDFKVGIIEGGQWQGATFLEDNPHFKGYVVFLR